MPDVVSMIPEKINKPTLCSESQMSCGNVLTSPITAAPAPIETSKAGNAQQNKVLKEPNKAIVDISPEAARFSVCIIFLSKFRLLYSPHP